jgi:DNA repair protein RadA/Sms
MGKERLSFVCSNCGAQFSSWAGKCTACDSWNSLEEVVTVSSSTSRNISSAKLKPENISTSIAEKENRLELSNKQVNDLLGGGVVKGSVILLSGEPGIGKSTLLLQLAEAVNQNLSVLYVSGEESLQQVALRAKRLKISNDNIHLVNSNSTDQIINAIESNQYNLVIVDSIQTISLDSIHSAAGNVSQITNSTNLIIRAAKSSLTSVILVGHVTKEGYIAGPKILEHLVDVVLHLEGDKFSGFKTLRANKNRFGSVNEVVLFEMHGEGLAFIENPSKSLLEERQVSDGSIVHACMQGSRPLLVEIQALVNKTSYGYPKRTASGFDLNRLNLIIAIIERRTKLKLFNDDIYINVVGGIKLTEPAADLAVAMAIASAKANKNLKEDLVVFGELGLSGEIRNIPFIEKRAEEAIKIGFKGSIGPKTSKTTKGYKPVSDLRTALIDYLG